MLAAIDGRRSCAEIATIVGQTMRRGVSEDMVATLVDQHLRPMGLLKLADGREPSLASPTPVGAEIQTRRHQPPDHAPADRPVPVPLPASAGLGRGARLPAVTWWVFFEQGLAPATYDAFQRPHLLLLVFVMTVLWGFHEFGHAAAARYSGADPGVIGAGIYIVWPAFYTDVTDSYRLGRWGRICTDLGGLYFNAVVVVLTFGWWYATRWDALLLLVATQIMQMVQQLMPLLRFDGYHLLADLTGVPDLYHRIRPTLLGLLPHRWSDPENRVLKPWARAVITVWVLITIPMLGLMLLAMVTAVPRLLGTGWSVVQEDAAGVLDAWRTGGLVDVTAHALQVLAVVLPCWRVSSSSGESGCAGLKVSRAGAAGPPSSGSPPQPSALPSSRVSPGHGGRSRAPTGRSYRGRGAAHRLAAGRAERSGCRGNASVGPGGRDGPRPRGPSCRRVGRAQAGRRGAAGGHLPGGNGTPTKSDPQLAIVLVPSEDDGDGQPPTPTPAPAEPDEAAEPWVFPFDEPLPPAEGTTRRRRTTPPTTR